MNTVYKITSPSGKKYIGKTSNYVGRMYSYKSGHCKNQKKLYNSFQKYGFNAHSVEIVWEGLCEDYELSIIEQFWIAVHRTFVDGMNLTLGGEGTVGYKLSEEHRAAISARMKGKKGSANQKAFVTKRMLENNPMKSEKSRKKLSEARKGIRFSEEHKSKLFAKVSTPQARAKAAESKRGKRMGSDNHNAKGVVQRKGALVLAEFDSAATASRMTGIQRANITKCCLGERTTAGGFNWAYNE